MKESTVLLAIFFVSVALLSVGGGDNLAGDAKGGVKGKPANECKNGVDDDGDGFVDQYDYGCKKNSRSETNCRDGVCTGNENIDTCPADCKPPSVCGDGLCARDETESCPEDCEVLTGPGNFSSFIPKHI